MTYFEQVTEAAEFLSNKLGGLAPRLGVVLGSGLGAVAEAVESPVFVPYGEIPHFPQSTVEGHSGRIVAGLLGGVPVVVMQGRVHSYEGYTPQQVTFPMRVLGRLGFFDMTEGYSLQLRALAQDAARAEGFALHEGVYLATSGPSFETPAEIRAFHALGADLVGMSTVPETIVARHMGIRVLGISCVTNLAAGISATQLSHEEVFEAGGRVQHQLARLLKRLAPSIAATQTDVEPAK